MHHCKLLTPNIGCSEQDYNRFFFTLFSPHPAALPVVLRGNDCLPLTKAKVFCTASAKQHMIDKNWPAR